MLLEEGVCYDQVAINPTIEQPELTQDWEIDSWRAQTELVHTRTQEKGVVTPQKTDPDLPRSVQKSAAKTWISGGLLLGWEH